MGCHTLRCCRRLNIVSYLCLRINSLRKNLQEHYLRGAFYTTYHPKSRYSTDPLPRFFDLSLKTGIHCMIPFLKLVPCVPLTWFECHLFKTPYLASVTLPKEIARKEKYMEGWFQPKSLANKLRLGMSLTAIRELFEKLTRNLEIALKHHKIHIGKQIESGVESYHTRSTYHWKTAYTRYTYAAENLLTSLLSWKPSNIPLFSAMPNILPNTSATDRKRIGDKCFPWWRPLEHLKYPAKKSVHTNWESGRSTTNTNQFLHLTLKPQQLST